MLLEAQISGGIAVFLLVIGAMLLAASTDGHDLNLATRKYFFIAALICLLGGLYLLFRILVQ